MAQPGHLSAEARHLRVHAGDPREGWPHQAQPGEEGLGAGPFRPAARQRAPVEMVGGRLGVSPVGRPGRQTLAKRVSLSLP